MLDFINRNFLFKKKFNYTSKHQLSQNPDVNPPRVNDMAKLETLQRRATRSSRLCVMNLVKRGWQDETFFPSRNLTSTKTLIECFEILKGFMNVDTNKLFPIDDLQSTRSNKVKLRCRQMQLDFTKFFFINDVVREWNQFHFL